MPKFWRTIEFWTAILTPVLIVLWPLAVAALPFLSVLTAEQVTVVIAGGIVAIITALFGFTYFWHMRARTLAILAAANITARNSAPAQRGR
jgi:membrane protease YdiL (CAAX protease family)